MKCGNMAPKDYIIFQTRKDVWLCRVCTFDQLPFNGLDSTEIESLWLEDPFDWRDDVLCSLTSESGTQESTSQLSNIFDIRAKSWRNILTSHLNIN